jgi:hypothetical protein
MKKLLLIFMAAFALNFISCTQPKSEPVVDNSDTIVVVDTVDSID